MRRIKVLDCTLRDGGYINQWKFGRKNINKVLSLLEKSKVDIVECGYLTNADSYDDDYTNFNTIKSIEKFISSNKEQNMYVCMINYGEYDIESIPNKEETLIEGIRVAFHKKDLVEALNFCQKIGEKGYKVFVQPMVSLMYRDEEFLRLIELSNKINPYAFYIVDSFGVMKKNDLIRFFYLVEHNLDRNICIGYHSHNNLQLAYSNAQALAELPTSRNLIIDSSVFGMGRGAGNLNTELFAQYLNDNMDSIYDVKPLLEIIDEVLGLIYSKNYWGYSLPHYISAVHNLHPNYATYLSEKNSLTIGAIDEILSNVEDDRKNAFDKAYIDNLYDGYMQLGRENETCLLEFVNSIKDKKILIIAPGKSSNLEKDKIVSMCSQKDTISISINNIYPYYETDYIFVGNIKRFQELGLVRNIKTIATSNISSNDVFLKVKYSELLNTREHVKDNSGLMILKFLQNLNIKEVYLAGVDGYSIDNDQNYMIEDVALNTKRELLFALNKEMNEVLMEYKKNIQIKFITSSQYFNKK